MELWTVLHDQVVNLNVLAIDHVNQMWSVILVVYVLFIVHKQYDPPMVPSTVYFTTTIDFDMSAIVDLNKIPVSFGISLTGPEFNIF